MGGVAPATMTAGAGRRFRLASPTGALVLGGLVLALMIADVPLARLAHQSLAASGGSVPVLLSAPFAVVGFVLACRKPGNPLGWVILGVAGCFALSEDASYYTVADYRLGHGGLPLGWLALLAQPGWAPGITLLGLVVLLFPDGRPRSSGERRQQPKWLMAGSAVAGAGIGIPLLLLGGAGGPFVLAGFLALPLSIGVAVLRYRLFDIDRIISRTLAYAIVTGLLVGVYAGLVLLANRVVSINNTPVVVAASTLAAAALFNPLRRRVQGAVDRRFNRARYDAGRTVAAFAARLQDTVDLDSVRDDLAGVVQQALEPAHVSVWLNERW